MKGKLWHTLASRRRGFVKLGLILALLVSLTVLARLAQAAVAPPPAGSGVSSGVYVGHSYKNDTSPPLRDLPPAPPRAGQERETHVNPFLVGSGRKDAPDASAVQRFLAPLAMPTPGLNFDGISRTNYGVPDTNGEAGATQYLELTNGAFQVFNKSNGDSLLGPSPIETIWSGFGAPARPAATAIRSCSTTNWRTAGSSAK